MRDEKKLEVEAPHRYLTLRLTLVHWNAIGKIYMDRATLEMAYAMSGRVAQYSIECTAEQREVSRTLFGYWFGLLLSAGGFTQLYRATLKPCRFSQHKCAMAQTNQSHVNIF